MVSLVKYILIVIIIFYLYPDEVCTIDFGVVTLTQIKFFSNGSNDTTKDIQLKFTDAFVYVPIENDIYVSDSYEEIGRIIRIKIAGGTASNVTTIVARQEWPVQGIAFDHIKSTLYWITDGGIFNLLVPYDEITDSRTGKVLLSFDGESPQGLAVDFIRGYLYWGSLLSTQNATIEQSQLDGTDRKTLVKGLTDPRGITLDVERNTLYWINWNEDTFRSIHSVNLHNRIIHTLVVGTEERNPFVFALDDLNVYWLDWMSEKLWMMPKNRRNMSVTLESKIQLGNRPIGLFKLSGGYPQQADEEDSGNNVNVFVTRAVSKDSRFSNYYNHRNLHNHN